MVTSFQAESFKPGFVVGVTGHMDLDPAHQDRIKTDVKRVFAWLREPSSKFDRNKSHPILGPGLGLTDTPIILLSSLAPGADQWVAQAAREMDPPLRILAPLPFVKEQYLQASTFKRDGATKDEAASNFLAEFPDEDVFPVRLLDEVDLDDAALRAKHESILSGHGDQNQRGRRYAAAGEYVVVYSNILIALTDKPIGRAENAVVTSGVEPGARAMAELKRRGVTSHLLPMLPTLSWADSGPVVHIYAPRKSKEEPIFAKKLPEAEANTLEVLYPYDCRPPEISESENDNPDWRRAGYAILKATAQHLQRLNTENIQIDPAREDAAFAEMLPEVDDASLGEKWRSTLLAASEPLRATLDRLARLRRRIADYSEHYNAHLNRLKRLLFSLAFCAALFFALADNWDVQNGMSWLPQAFFVTAFGLTLATWIVFFYFKRTAAAERCDNYRAITEGLRVQFYWTASGSGESVASNYLQRQHSELGWIRHVISVATFPSEPDRVRFNQLPVNDQLTALRSIRSAWIGRQDFYFRNKMEELSLRREVFTTYAHILLWTGFVLFAFLVFFAQGTGSPLLSRPLYLLSFAAGFAILAFLCSTTFSQRRRHAPASTLNPKEQQERGRDNPKAEPLIPRLLNWLLSLPTTLLPERIPCGKSGPLILRSLLVVAFTLLIIGTVYFLEGAVPGLPSANKLGSILKYLALAGGVLCGAWVEVNFFAENIRHYASMASLFQAAGLRFDEFLSWSEQASADQRETIQRQAIAYIRSLTVAVGREALSENGEWLIIHRARPLEPVSV